MKYDSAFLDESFLGEVFLHYNTTIVIHQCFINSIVTVKIRVHYSIHPCTWNPQVGRISLEVVMTLVNNVITYVIAVN